MHGHPQLGHVLAAISLEDTGHAKASQFDARLGGRPFGLDFGQGMGPDAILHGGVGVAI